MALTEGQVQVADLIMGRDTAYKMREFNPWVRETRADHTGDNPWGNGGYSGAEWLDTSTVAMLVRVLGINALDWNEKHWALTSVFSPVETGPDVELRWVTGGIEYLMRGRPTVVDPKIRHLRKGEILTRLGIRCDDPLIYSAELHETVLGLPQWSGGLHVDMHVPADIDATVVDGAAELTNAGTRTARMLFRIDGPVTQPTIQLGGATLTLGMTIPAGHWVDIDTVDRTVLYDGVTSRLTDASGTWPVLPPGTHPLKWSARSGYHVDASLTARHRDTY